LRWQSWQKLEVIDVGGAGEKAKEVMLNPLKEEAYHVL